MRPFGPPAARSARPDAAVASAPRPVELRGGRAEVVQLAQGLVGQTALRLGERRLPNDCTGLVAGVYGEIGLDLLSGGATGDNAVTAIYRFARVHGRIYERGRPAPGDLVFFRETYDRNRDGRANDGLTHVGIVEDVAEDGTVSVIHRVSRGVVRYRMNIDRPHERVDARTGRPLNDFLRTAGPAHSQVLTGQLFAAYASLLPPPQARAVGSHAGGWLLRKNLQNPTASAAFIDTK